MCFKPKMPRVVQSAKPLISSEPVQTQVADIKGVEADPNASGRVKLGASDRKLKSNSGLVI